jgi:hypothetical protein
MKEKAVYILIAVLFVFGIITYFVQQRTNDFLQRKIEDLEVKIAEIDTSGGKILNAEDERFLNRLITREKWLKLTKGMNIDQVKELLGVPTRIQTSRNSMNYEYQTGKTSGYVYFDENQRVERWDEPIF